MFVLDHTTTNSEIANFFIWHSEGADTIFGAGIERTTPREAFFQAYDSSGPTDRVATFASPNMDAHMQVLTINSAALDFYQAAGGAVASIQATWTGLHVAIPTLNSAFFSVGGFWQGDAANQPPNRAYDGVMAEILCYNRRLTTVEIEQLRSYSSAKWGT